MVFLSAAMRATDHQFYPTHYKSFSRVKLYSKTLKTVDPHHVPHDGWGARLIGLPDEHNEYFSKRSSSTLFLLIYTDITHTHAWLVTSNIENYLSIE